MYFSHRPKVPELIGFPSGSALALATFVRGFVEMAFSCRRAKANKRREVSPPAYVKCSQISRDNLGRHTGLGYNPADEHSGGLRVRWRCARGNFSVRGLKSIPGAEF